MPPLDDRDTPTSAERIQGEPPPPAPREAPNLTALGLLRSLGRRWLHALNLGLVCSAAAAALVWFFLPPAKDTARALLYVAASQPKVAFPTGEGSRGDFLTYQRTQLALLKSRLVLNAALRQPGVAQLALVREQSDAIQWLEKEIRADFTTGPEILRVSMSTGRAGEARTVVDAVVKAYLEEIVNKDHIRRVEQLEKLKNIANKYDETLRRKKSALKQTAELVGTTDGHTLALKQRFAQEQLSAAQKELLQVQADLRRLRIELAVQSLQDGPAPATLLGLLAAAPGLGFPAHVPWGAALFSVPGAAGAAEAAVVDPAVVEALVDEQLAADAGTRQDLTLKARLEDDLARARKVVIRGDQDPNLLRYQQDLESVRQSLEKRRAALRPGVARRLRDKANADGRALTSQVRQRATLLAALEELLASETRRLGEETRSLGQGSVNLESYKQDVVHYEEMARRLASEVEVLNVELQAPSRVTPLEDAVVVSADNQKRRLMATTGAWGGTLLLVLFSVAWREYRARRISSLREVEDHLGLKIVGTVPAIPDRKWRLFRGVRSPEEWQARILESVDAARTIVLHRARKYRVQVVMVTSAVSGEGKTTLSGHLAMSLARAGHRTLLLDCDLRSPASHRLFETSRGPGLAELLRDEVTPVEVIQETRVPGLHLIPAGTVDARSLQGLARDKLDALFAALRPDYHFVIVDTCPLLPVTDALLIAQKADAVLFSILQGVSQVPLVQAAGERLAMLDIAVLGAVVTGTGGHGYGYSYSYGNGQADGRN